MKLFPQKLISLARDRSAAVAVEFAFIFPLMLLLLLGTIEIADVLTVNKRVQEVSSSLGDLVSRSGNSLTESTLDDYFAAVSNVMAPHSAENLQQVVTSVFVDENGDVEVQWSRQFNGGTTHAKGSSLDLPAEFRTIADRRYVIVAETQMAYSPKFGYGISETLNLSHEAFYIPRSGGQIGEPD